MNRLLHASHIPAKFMVSTFVANINYGITGYNDYRACLNILLAMCNEFTKWLNMEDIEGTKHRRLWGGGMNGMKHHISNVFQSPKVRT